MWKKEEPLRLGKMRLQRPPEPPSTKTIVIGNVYQGNPTDDPEEALRIYREVLLEESGRLPISGLDIRADDPTNRDNPLQLTNVYVTLNTTQKQAVAHGSRGDDSEEEIPITALGMCGQRRRLVLLGDPGGGKSTFVNHLAYSLAALQLKRQRIGTSNSPPNTTASRPNNLP